MLSERQKSYRGTRGGASNDPWRTCPGASRLVQDWYRTGTRQVQEVEDAGGVVLNELAAPASEVLVVEAQAVRAVAPGCTVLLCAGTATTADAVETTDTGVKLPIHVLPVTLGGARVSRRVHVERGERSLALRPAPRDRHPHTHGRHELVVGRLRSGPGRCCVLSTRTD